MPPIESLNSDEKRAELRAKIIEMAQIDREPPIRGRRLRDTVIGSEVS